MQHDASYPWEEPGAGNPHARICEGESRMAELLDQFPHASDYSICGRVGHIGSWDGPIGPSGAASLVETLFHDNH